MANLKSLSVGELLRLRREVDEALHKHKRTLEQQLASFGGTRKQSDRRSGKVAAKYRHPKTGEEWSGRGGVAKWLAAEIKAGKKKESFLIK